MIDRRCLRYFDWISFLFMVALLGVGLLFVFSATYRPGQPVSLFFKKQLFGVVSGLIFYIIASIKDWRNFYRGGAIGYFVLLVLLAYTAVSGVLGMGATRWFSLGFFKFQPSEIAKFLFPVFVASYFYESKLPKYHFAEAPGFAFRDFLFPLGVLGVSFILIRKQPDLGTALIVLGSGLILLWFVGLSKYFFLAGFAFSIVAAPILWKCLKSYQQDRILVLFGYGDMRKERYQTEQSKIAVGSGGVWGKGFLNGTQSKLEFLPEDHTDFIFAVICEEWGLMGALCVIMLFVGLFVRLMRGIAEVSTAFDQVIALGLFLPVLLSVCINIGMVLGVLPIVGIPLPFVTYGITHLWITLVSLGWINNIAIRRFYF